MEHSLSRWHIRESVRGELGVSESRKEAGGWTVVSRREGRWGDGWAASHLGHCGPLESSSCCIGLSTGGTASDFGRIKVPLTVCGAGATAGQGWQSETGEEASLELQAGVHGAWDLGGAGRVGKGSVTLRVILKVDLRVFADGWMGCGR